MKNRVLKHPYRPAWLSIDRDMSANRHNRIYTILLIVSAFLLLTSIITMLSMTRMPGIAPDAQWVFEMTACSEAAYLAAIVITLILRGKSPAAGRIATTALNIVLLVLFPLGTALGIYGLMKVDKQSPTAGYEKGGITD
jgi:hypothetical protein